MGAESIDADQLHADLTMGLQIERTSLAWNRTLVVLASIFGLIAVHALVTTLAWPLAIGCSLIAAGILASAVMVAHRRLRQLRRQIRSHLAVNATAQALVLTVAAAFASVLALIAIITQR